MHYAMPQSGFQFAMGQQLLISSPLVTPELK